MRKLKFKEGDKHGKVTLIRRVKKENPHIMVLYKCDCGNTKEGRLSDILRGVIKSCGCLPKNYKHGMWGSRTYNTWRSMLARCNNPKEKDYKNYGGRGIKVCKRWFKIQNFIKDMGESPLGKTLDRINNQLGYKPSNCRWSNVEEQQNNKRTNVFLEHEGKKLTISQWARFKKINKVTLWGRLNSGWSVKKALETKVETKVNKLNR